MNKEVIKKIFNKSILLTAGIFLFAVGINFGQTSKENENPQIKAQLEAAKAALEKKDFGAATLAYERAIEIDPFNHAAHSGLTQIGASQYISRLFVDGAMITDEKVVKELADSFKSNQEKTIVRYKDLEAKYPEKAVFKVILASLNTYEPLLVKDYLEQAYRLEPNSLPVLNALAYFEVARGDTRKAVQYFTKISRTEAG